MDSPLRSTALPSRRRPSMLVVVRRGLSAALVLSGVFSAIATASAGDPKEAKDAKEIAPASASAAQPDAVDDVALEPPAISIGVIERNSGASVPSSVAIALHALTPQIAACYRAAIDAEGDVEATMSLRLELDGPGRVVSATVSESDEASATLRDCVRRAFLGVAAGAVGPAPMEVVVPIAFTRGVPDDALRPASACSDDAYDGELPDALRAEVRGRAIAASACFKRPANPGEASVLKPGSADLELRIADDGTVCGVAAIGDTFGRPSLTSCVLEAMSAPFGEKPNGAVEVRIPLEFKGN